VASPGEPASHLTPTLATSAFPPSSHSERQLSGSLIGGFAVLGRQNAYTPTIIDASAGLPLEEQLLTQPRCRSWPPTPSKSQE
jgi:hypothetical protein